MEEKVSLALAVKLKKMFEDKEDQFLTFPLGVAYAYRDLDFMKEESSLSALERLHFKADFARLMNAIPEDRITFSLDLGRMLWNETKDVLINAEFATSTLSPSEEKQLAEAIDFLTNERAEDEGLSIPVPSAQYEAYKTYKDLYYTAEKTYQNEKLTIESAAGEEGQRLKKIWESGREQELHQFKEEAMNDWISLGFKNQIETCQRIQNTLELKRSPILYRQNYLDEIDIAEVADIDAQGIVFCVTFFNPYNAFDRFLSWNRITLIKEEIENLIRQAPVELKGMFNAVNSSEDIESLSLEYRFVDIVRPWYRPEFFHNGYWKMSHDIVVCDGALPRQGKIPAYITGLLAVRNITTTKKRTTSGKENVLPILQKIPLQKLGSMKLAPLILPSATRAAHIAKPMLVKPMTIPNHRSTGIHISKPVSDRIVVKPSSKSSFFANRILTSTLRATSKKEINTSELYKKAFLRAKYEGMTIKAPSWKPTLVAVSPINKPSAEKEKETVTKTYSFDGITVLAYVCRRLPKSPNPDLTLQW
jgi:hypothetical protein